MMDVNGLARRVNDLGYQYAALNTRFRRCRTPAEKERLGRRYRAVRIEWLDAAVALQKAEMSMVSTNRK